MATRAVRNEQERADLLRYIKQKRLPFTASVVDGEQRSSEQNRLQRMWMSEAEAQGDQTAEEYRGYCKLHFGVPILRYENEEFREAYDRVIKPRLYEEKLVMMMEPLDFPITRLMTTGQKTRYLDAVYQHFRGLGFVLTEPEGRRAA